MFRHIVCFKLQEGKKDQAEEAKKRLLTLPIIPEVKHVEVGIDEKGSPRSYDLVLIVDCDSREDYETYDAHELHQPVRNFMKSICETTVAVDFYRD